jgi:hypothetical protein
VGLLSLSALRTKSFSSLRAILTSPSVVRNAARQGSHNVTEVVVVVITVPDVRCSPQYVPSVAKTPKYPLNHAVIDLFIVAIATVKPDRVFNAGV